MRKYICDNCGKDVEDPEKLQTLLWRWQETEEDFVGEYCRDCKAKIEARIKEGVN